MRSTCLIRVPNFLLFDEKMELPLGILYLGASLRQVGVPVQCVDLAGVPREQWLDRIPSGFDVYGWSATTPEFPIATNMMNMVRERESKAIMIIGGSHSSARPWQCIDKGWDVACVGEGEETIKELGLEKPLDEIWGLAIRCGKNPLHHRPLANNLDTIPFPAWDLLPEDSIVSTSLVDKGQRASCIITSRGCPFTCLAGDTIIHTIGGDFPIKDLMGKTGIKVLSRDNETQEPCYVDAINIAKIKEGADVVRVFFNDGSYIDCTPDHKFKVFKQKNQYSMSEKEWDVEAKDLLPKQQVRAVAFYTHKTGRIYVSTRRDIEKCHAHIVFESKIGRKLKYGERVHHNDRNPANDSMDNLTLTDKHNHMSLHPEVSERMKKNNPVWNIPPEIRSANSRKNAFGKKRSVEQRLRYRESKLGSRNPNYLESANHRRSHRSRVVNHKIEKVEWLVERKDVFCMEIPSTHWFYANKVLVHNCSFCSQVIWQDGSGKKVFRQRSVDNILSEIEELKARYEITEVRLVDDLVTKSSARIIAAAIGVTGLKWRTHLRVDLVDRETVKELQESGCVELAFGLENGSPEVRVHNGKRFDNQKFIEACAICREFGIRTKAYIIVGLPGESWRSVAETMLVLAEAKPDKCNLSAFIPLPGSDIEEHPINYDWKPRPGLRDDEKWLLGFSEGNYLPTGYTSKMDVDEIFVARSMMFDFLKAQGWRAWAREIGKE